MLFIPRKHTVNTMWHLNNNSLWQLKFPKKTSQPICHLETSNWTESKTPRQPPNWQSRRYNSKTCSLWTPKWASKWYKIDKVSTTYPFQNGLWLRSPNDLPFSSHFLRFGSQNSPTCIKFYLTPKHSNNTEHQQYIEFYRFNIDSSIYMTA